MSKKYFLISFFLIFSYLQGFSKSVIIVLDNSASMNQYKTLDLSQCVSANYALQLFLATLNPDDKAIIIFSKKRGESLTILEPNLRDLNKSIIDIQGLNCTDALMLEPLKKGLEIFESENVNEKLLVLIGDGEWFVEEDKLTLPIENELVNKLSKLSQTHTLIYLNTSPSNNGNNIFYNRILKNQSLNETKVYNTDASAVKLLENVESISKELLCVPDVFTDYTIVGNTLTIDNKISLSCIFIEDQNFGSLSDGLLENIESKTNKLTFSKKIKIGKENLNAWFYEIKSTVGFIKPDHIKIDISGILNSSRKLQVFAIPDFSQGSIIPDSTKIKGYINGLYGICEDEANVKISFKLSHLKEERLSDEEIRMMKVKVISLMTNSTTLLSYDNKEFSGIVSLDPNYKEERFQVEAEIPGYYHFSERLGFTKRSCLKLEIENYTFKVNYSLLDTNRTIQWKIAPPVIRNFRSKVILPDEFQYVVNSVPVSPYSINKTKDGFTLSLKNNLDPLSKSCFCSARSDTLNILLKHDNADNTAVLKIVIEKTDKSLFNRCLKLILLLLAAFLFLIYLYFIINKSRFKSLKKKKKNAHIVLYEKTIDDKGYMGKFPLKTNFINRYLNPFGPEKKKVGNLIFIATKTPRIILYYKSINDNMKIGRPGLCYPFDKTNGLYTNYTINVNDSICIDYKNNQFVEYKF